MGDVDHSFDDITRDEGLAEVGAIIRSEDFIADNESETPSWPEETEAEFDERDNDIELLMDRTVALPEVCFQGGAHGFGAEKRRVSDDNIEPTISHDPRIHAVPVHGILFFQFVSENLIR
jgi:hypothetical protein